MEKKMWEICFQCFPKYSICTVRVTSNKGNELTSEIFMLSGDEAAVPRRPVEAVCESVCSNEKVSLTPRLGWSPQELRNCWECIQFHL